MTDMKRIGLLIARVLLFERSSVSPRYVYYMV